MSALQEISVELMTSRHLRDTLSVIVNKAVDLLVCDAGSVYLKQDDHTLVFEVAVNRSTSFDFERHTVPVQSRGLATHVFRTGESLLVKDVYRIAVTEPFVFDPSFDLKTGYRTKSVLIQPLISSKGDTLGVLQLINRKNSRGQKWPSQNSRALQRMPLFNEEDEKILRSFAAVASAAIESTTLHKNIENLFESFVTASVQAIESRDPVTRGHSDRVAILTTDLAEKVSRSQDSGVRQVHFTSQQIVEIRYASLLHDFGKIAVKESTLQKEEKLTPMQRLQIRSRLDDFKAAAEVRSLRDYVQRLLKDNRPPTELELKSIERTIQDFGMKIEDYWKVVLSLNQPTVLSQDRRKTLSEISGIECTDCKGIHRPLLEPGEVFSLSVQKGSLTDDERLEIESHVTHTYQFLRKIPWTRDLSSIPEIAFAHHERLDGSGYPLKKISNEIPVQARLMAICDVFDALAANDRPYKPALPIGRSLEILEMEAKQGKLDTALLQVFVEAKVYEHPDFVRLMDGPIKRAA